MDNQDIIILLDRYNQGICTPEEQAVVETWYLNEVGKPLENSIEELSRDLDEIEDHLARYIKRRVIFTWPRVAVAASLLVMLSFGGYFLSRKQPVAPIVYLKQDIGPANQHATLTLSNGQRIILTKSALGKLAQQGSTSIDITKNEGLKYSEERRDNKPVFQFNILSTVRGEQAPFTLQLADGTKVWLNAASSITYPVAFKGKERSVSVTGEVYFEVVHMSNMPFRVNYKNQTAEDIGTHFNINAYDDEPMTKTTLLEGSIRILKDNQRIVLRPGQQATSTQAAGLVKVKEVDTEEAVAWKNGYFLFDNERLESVMRKISRWYNVYVDYPPGQTIRANYWGSMSREANLSVVLRKLETTNNVRFKLEGNHVIVLRK